MARPYRTESWWPWCAKTIAHPRLRRLHDDGAEYHCPDCGKTHMRKEGIEDRVFFFFPADIAAMTQERIPPVFDEEEGDNLGKAVYGP